MPKTKPNPSLAVWGLTGGIASGKSTVARLLAERKVPVIDADQVSRQLSVPGGAAYPLILKRFGTVDRAALRKTVFADPQARKDLEAILHPLIRTESLRQIQVAATTSVPGVLRPVVYEAALLVESGRSKDLAGLIVVDCPSEVRKQRLIARDHIDPALADRILAAQIGDDERLKAATAVIKNSGSLDQLKMAVDDLIECTGLNYE